MSDMWPEFARILDNARQAPPLEARDLDAMRTTMEDALIRWAGEIASVSKIEEFDVTTESGTLRLVLYTPHSLPDKSAPAIVLCHGGGFVLGGRRSHEPMARSIADKARCVVVLVEYRLAPEHPYPAAVEDVVAAFEWLSENAGALNIDPSRIGLWGESAGGTIAAAATIRAVAAGFNPRALLIAYAPLCARLDTKSWESFGTGYWLTRATMAWFWRQYLGPTPMCTEELAEPLHARSLAQMPPTLIITADLDPLQDEGTAFARALRDAGTRVDHRRCAGAIHGFLAMQTLSSKARELSALYAQDFSKMLRDGEDAASA